MSHGRRAVACIVTLTAALFVFAVPAGSVPPASVTSADAAVTWIDTQQQPDGGFEVAGFAGFETPDAALAIAENGQSGSAWSTADAIAAVDAVRYNGNGPTAFNALDTYAASGISQGKAGKLIVLSAEPFGFNPSAFDPAGNGTPTDLVDIMGCDTTSDAALNNLLYIVIGQVLACGGAQPDAVATVRADQQANGGWNFVGDPAGTDIDLDSTSVAVEALIAAGAGPDDPALQAALRFFAANQQTDGAWQSFGLDDPNSTALAIVGITALGYDVESPCWRDTADPTLAGTAYASPTTWIVSQQLADGRIVSPNDDFGVNTFATSQSVEGLLQSWLPIVRLAAQSCEVSITPVTPVTPTAPVNPIVAAAVEVSPRFTG
jgi:hypothetical protein